MSGVQASRDGPLPGGGFLLVLGALTGLLALGAALSRELAREHLSALDVMRRAPRATLAAPASGPAVYHGVLDGPSGRVSPLGRAAAVYLWRISVGPSRGRRTSCEDRGDNDLVLRDGGHAVAVPLLHGAGSLLLLDDAYAGAWIAGPVLDLGAGDRRETGQLPPIAAGCNTGGSPIYTEDVVPQGASVDVLACYRDHALVPCEGPLPWVMSVGGLRVHQGRRASRAMVPFQIAAGLALAVLLGTTVVARSFRARVLEATGRRARRPR